MKVKIFLNFYIRCMLSGTLTCVPFFKKRRRMRGFDHFLLKNFFKARRILVLLLLFYSCLIPQELNKNVGFNDEFQNTVTDHYDAPRVAHT